MNNETIKKAQENMDKSIKVYQKKLASIRAGVANAALLDNVQVEYYGAPTPLTQMSSITIPEPRVLLITPYDQNSLDDIEHALLASNLGLTPANDGKVIRLVIPQLTGERREEIAKEVKRPVVQSLIKLLKFRNEEAAFDLDGSIEVETPSENEIVIRRSNKNQLRTAEAKVNLKDLSYNVKVNDQEVRF